MLLCQSAYDVMALDCISANIRGLLLSRNHKSVSAFNTINKHLCTIYHIGIFVTDNLYIVSFGFRGVYSKANNLT